ncbi:MAG TPA: PA domain-containing protein [Burkholderiaceae bacterium]|nr:PA domain-containing protein [Burkholderiaceae bacterium]
MITDRIRAWGKALRHGCVVAAAACAALAQAATLQIFTNDAPGVGFNEPTPAAPVGGNTGTTVGEQRRIVFEFAAKFWGAKLNSDVPITIWARFSPLPCDSTSGVLGAAGAWNVFSDFPNGRPATWYPAALANKLAGVRLFDDPDFTQSADIRASFNGDLGKTGCLDGLSFYLGLDGKADPNTQIDLVTTILHEFGHGLGFQTFTDEVSGLFFPYEDFPDLQMPSIWDYFLFDPQQRKAWADMTPDQRITSAITPRNLVWNGKQVTKNAHKVLNHGTPEFFVAGKGLNKFYMNGPAEFGPPIDERVLIATELVHVVDQASGLGLACTPLDATNAALVKNKIAIIDRGACTFVTKVKNAQLAGAKAVVIADNNPSVPPQPLAGIDATIKIPSMRISQVDGNEIKTAIAATPPKLIGPFGVLFENQLKLEGADYLQRVFMFTPNPVQPGSSVSHYDTLAKPNLLMEPFDTPHQPIAVSPPQDLTLQLLLDIGWGN